MSPSYFSHIHLWAAKLNLGLIAINHFISYLTSNELQRAYQFTFEPHRHDYILARGQLRYLLSQYLAKMPQHISITQRGQHKPFLADSSLQFNLSHSQEKVYYAFSWEQMIGIDIEYMGDKNIASLAQFCLSTFEQEYFSTLSPQKQHAYFYRNWVCKEAILKALGLGLTYPLQSLSLPTKGSTFQIKIINKEMYVHHQELADNYACALASDRPIQFKKFYLSHK